MDDATQKLVDEAAERRFPGNPDGPANGVTLALREAFSDGYRAALEAAQRRAEEDHAEANRLVNEYAVKAGNLALDLEAARAVVDAYERDAVERSEQGRTDYDYEQKIAALEAAQRPPASPEVREALARTVMGALGCEMQDDTCDCEYPCAHKPYSYCETHDLDADDGAPCPKALAVADTILARFSVPSQQHVGDWDADRAEYVCSCGSALNAWWPDGMAVSGGESAFDKWMRLHPAVPSQPVYDEEMVERAAKALLVADVPGTFTLEDWALMSEEGRGEFRRCARAALVAALPGLTKEENRG